MSEFNTFSLCLSKFIGEIIGSQETIKKRRRVYRLLETLCRNRPTQTVTNTYTGSRPEGVDLEDSDMDVMNILNLIKVSENEPCDQLDTRVINVVMRNSLELPGTVVLEVVNTMCEPYSDLITFLMKSLVQCSDRILISSALFRDNYVSLLNSGFDTLQQGRSNGPSITSDNLNLDIAVSFHCSSWPQLASEWLDRHRPYGWPSKTLIETIKESGCYVVPVGESITNNSDIIWRISFATAETQLIRSLNYVQFKTYALLKIVLNEVFKSISDDSGPLLSSYVMKTIICYAVENTPLSFWVEKNFFSCFWFCFNVLVNCVTTGFCPNYFFPAKNMFRKRVHGRNRLALLRLLHNFKARGINSIYKCRSLMYLRYTMESSLQIAQYMSYTTPAIDVEYLNDIFMYGIVNISKTDSVNTLFKLMLTSSCENEIYQLLYRLMNMLCTNAIVNLENGYRNIHIYLKLRQSRRRLLFNTHTDAGSGWSTLASYHYFIGQYKHALEICQHVTSSWSPSIMYCGVIMNKNAYKKQWCGHGIPVYLKFRNALMDPIHFRHGVLCPVELHPEVFMNTHDTLFIPPISYASFLSFLCHHRLDNGEETLSSLQDLHAWAAFDEEVHHIVKNCSLHINYSMIGICYEMIGDIEQARKFYIKSIETDPKYPAGIWRLERLLS